jgi:hypothetical protein
LLRLRLTLGYEELERHGRSVGCGERGAVVAEMESRRPCDTEDRRGPFSDRVDVVPIFPLGMTDLARGPSRVGGRQFVPRGLV